MKPYSSSASLKRLAKGQLIGNYGTAVSITFIHMLSVYLLSMVLRIFVGSGTLFQDILYLAVSFLASLFVGLFSAGEAYVYLKLACNQPILVGDLFYCFREEASRVLPLQAVIAGISTILLLPSALMNYLPTALQGLMLLLSTVLSIVSIVLLLMLSQVFYLMLDFPDYSTDQLFKSSIQLMKGSKGRLFYIQLSFLPLFLLGVLSCCIGFLWLFPFYQSTMANFYLDVVKKHRTM